MPNIRVNSSVMNNVASDIKSSANGIQNKLDTMDAELRQLATNWSGDAQQAYAVAKANWSSDMDHLRLVLAEISELVLEHNSNMGASDRRGSNRFSSY